MTCSRWISFCMYHDTLDVHELSFPTVPEIDSCQKRAWVADYISIPKHSNVFKMDCFPSELAATGACSLTWWDLTTQLHQGKNTPAAFQRLTHAHTHTNTHRITWESPRPATRLWPPCCPCVEWLPLYPSSAGEDGLQLTVVHKQIKHRLSAGSLELKTLLKLAALEAVYKALHPLLTSRVISPALSEFMLQT